MSNGHTGIHIFATATELKDSGWVLRRAYEKNEFCGGRGPKVWDDAEFIYSNDICRAKNFDGFAGREEIADYITDEILGMHDYWGMSLI